jgi:hypothetical protein
MRILLDLLLPRRYVCWLIDWLRPGAGHRSTAAAYPPACEFCGRTKGT